MIRIDSLSIAMTYNGEFTVMNTDPQTEVITDLFHTVLQCIQPRRYNQTLLYSQHRWRHTYKGRTHTHQSLQSYVVFIHNLLPERETI